MRIGLKSNCFASLALVALHQDIGMTVWGRRHSTTLTSPQSRRISSGMPMQLGSSLMPGKVNPVVPEVVNQICFQIIGYDAVILMAAEASELELNMAESIIEGVAAKVGNIDMQAGCEGGRRG